MSGSVEGSLKSVDESIIPTEAVVKATGLTQQVNVPALKRFGWGEPIVARQHHGEVHGVIFFPRWVADNPRHTVCFQNDHLDEMRRLRDAGPTYPKLVIDEFAAISFVEDCGVDNEAVIACGPGELPIGYASRSN